MRHLLMDPAFPDMVGAWAAETVDDKARVWTITRGADGRLEERLDPGCLAEALLKAAGEQDIAASRLW